MRSDYLMGELTFPKEHMNDVVSISSEMLASPQFNEAWIDRIKQGLRANQSQARLQTAHRMWAAARLAILKEGPLNDFLSLPNLYVIEDIKVEDIRRWHTETIVKNGATIVVSGAIDAQDAGKAIDQLFSNLPDKAVPTVPNVTPDFSPKTIMLHVPDAEKTTLGFIGQLPPTREGGDLTDLLALHIFSKPANGPLFDAVRTELRASYGFQAGYTNYDRKTRVMFITGEVETEKLSQASHLIQETYENFRLNPDLTGLDAQRGEIAKGTAQNVTYLDVAARTILELALDDLDSSDAPRMGELIENKTDQDIRDRLSLTFPPSDNLIVIVASPDANALPDACVITKIEQVKGCL